MKRFGWLFLLTLCAAPAYALPGATTTYLVCDDTLMAACSLGASGKTPLAGSVAVTAESSAVINIARFSRVGLRIRVIPSLDSLGTALATFRADTTTLALLAVAFKVPAPNDSVRVGGSQDSLAGFWQPPVDPAGFVAGMDSVVDAPSAVPPAGGGGACGFWPGELSVAFDPWMGRGAYKSDQFFAPTTKWIPLGTTTTGGGLLPPRLQVRVRLLRGYTVASGRKIRVQAWLDCTE